MGLRVVGLSTSRSVGVKREVPERDNRICELRKQQIAANYAPLRFTTGSRFPLFGVLFDELDDNSFHLPPLVLACALYESG